MVWRFARPGQENTDRFSVSPLVFAALLWLLCEAQLMMSSHPLGGLLPGPLMVLTALLIAISAASSLLSALIFGFLFKWRRCLSVLVAPIVFVTALFGAAVTYHGVRTYIGLAKITVEVALRRANKQSTDDISWEIYQSDNSWEDLVYDETDKNRPAPGQAVKTWINYDWFIKGCNVSARPQGEHVYLLRTDCPT